MKLTVLGCSGSMPGPDSPASSYLVEHEGYRLLLDLGSGAFGALQRHVPPRTVDAVVVSHLHVDHFVDLTAMTTYLKYAPGRTGRAVPLLGPPETARRLAQVHGGSSTVADADEMFADVYDFRPAELCELGPFRLDFAQMRHSIHANAVRVSAGGASVVYSGDTGPCDALVDLARDADLLLCEASVAPGEVQVPDLHLTGAQAGEHAARAGVRRLVVTHIPPWQSREVILADATTTFAGVVVGALADDSYDI